MREVAIEIDTDELHRRAEIARRLKAARWLAGGVDPSKTGKTGYAVTELTQVRLAEDPNLKANEITASLIGAIERMERPPRPMELEQIALALGQPADYFRDVVALSPTDAAEALARHVLAGARALGQAGGQGQQGEGGQGR